ncbi:chromate efflux transporter [Stenotrophomonas acidaminiphila]|uniref:chromate efflux transporter n=1 Tax=Stenotrophomonas acidaminiphila TaxID=128780 RepID=UPI0020C6697C|nr:chromate efflux transporter [Stenotrophomonas acidaminiphila]
MAPEAGTPGGNPATDARESAWGVFLVFLRLGLTAFGGPVAHLGYFHAEFVTRRRWLDPRGYADLVALCQFLPGPASSQVGMALGLSRCGYRGAFAAWAGFTLPSAIALIVLARFLAGYPGVIPSGVLHGLKIVAVAVVAQAVWNMGRNLYAGGAWAALVLAAAAIALRVPSAWMQPGLIAGAALAGVLLFRPTPACGSGTWTIPVGRGAGALWLALFFVLLGTLPLLAALLPGQAVAEASAFFRAGALVFGGGHVVLPLLQAAVVAPGWVDNDAFLAGYGAAQAMPGPLFAFAAFLGASMQAPPSGWSGGVLCLLAIFAPSFLLVAGALPFWNRLRGNARMRAALSGINAAVVGLLLAALYDPVWTGAIHAPRDIALALAALAALALWKLPPWLVVTGCGVAGAMLDL